MTNQASDRLQAELKKALAFGYEDPTFIHDIHVLIGGEDKVKEAQTAITQAIKAYVVAVKPELPPTFAALDDFGVMMYKKATDEYETNLLKGLKDASQDH